MTVEVRPLELDDLVPAVLLYEEVGAEGTWIRDVPATPAHRASTLVRFAAPLRDPSSAAAFVAVDGGAVVGMSAVDRAPYGVAHLGMHVAASHRGRGLGRRLLGAVLEWSRANGCHKVALEAWPNNAAAISLYLSSGFVVEGRLRRHYPRANGELWDTVVMGLVLDHDTPGSSLPDAPL